MKIWCVKDMCICTFASCKVKTNTKFTETRMSLNPRPSLFRKSLKTVYLKVHSEICNPVQFFINIAADFGPHSSNVIPEMVIFLALKNARLLYTVSLWLLQLNITCPSLAFGIFSISKFLAFDIRSSFSVP